MQSLLVFSEVSIVKGFFMDICVMRQDLLQCDNTITIGMQQYWRVSDTAVATVKLFPIATLSVC